MDAATRQTFYLEPVERLLISPPRDTHPPNWEVSSAAVDLDFRAVVREQSGTVLIRSGQGTLEVPRRPWLTLPLVSAESLPLHTEAGTLRQAKQAIRDAIVEETSAHVVFDSEALDRAYQLLIAAEPERERNSVCGRLSVGFPVRGEDYEDAPNDE
jgi:hypothetical protein